jgi:hypothetical protein
VRAKAEGAYRSRQRIRRASLEDELPPEVRERMAGIKELKADDD